MKTLMQILGAIGMTFFAVMLHFAHVDRDAEAKRDRERVVELTVQVETLRGEIATLKRDETYQKSLVRMCVGRKVGGVKK